MTTGMVLRAYAAHPKYSHSDVALQTGTLMKQRLHEKDTFTFRQAIFYWYKFQFPFWWTDLVSVLDSLAKIGIKEEDKDIQKSISWIVDNQNPNGTWNASYGGKNRHADEWVTLAICRVLKAFLG
jgi:squalene cyclase